MSIDYRIESADTGRLLTRLDSMPTAVRRALRAEITTLTNQLLRMVEAREPVRTGRLRRETVAFIDENPAKNFVRGRVQVLRGEGNLGARFGALEYGGPGQRRRGQPVVVHGYNRAGVPVRSYTRRRPTIQARRFLRSSAAVMLPKARERLNAIIRQTIEQGLLR